MSLLRLRSRSSQGLGSLALTWVTGLLLLTSPAAGQDPLSEKEENEPIPVLRLAVDRPLLFVGEQAQLTLTGVFPDGTSQDFTSSGRAIYISSDPEILTVEESGSILATGKGTGAIVALCEGLPAETLLVILDPNDRDSDGLSDEFEAAHGLDPEDPTDADGDLDGDGLSNLREVELGTEVDQADSDGDGVSDGIEVEQGRNPRGSDPFRLNASCTISAFNRTAPVQEDGVWVLPNVPANLGQVRVRATCVEDSVVRFGASSLITVPANGVLKIADINFQGPPPVPSTLALTAPVNVLSAVGQTLQLSAIGNYPGGSTADVTAEETGTDYRTSNPAIATVDANGLVTARASGVAMLSAVNEGALGVIRIQVVAAGDSDGDGLPDDWELANGLDPNNPVDALDDQDEDGLATIAEYQSGLDPFNGDSDGDGLKDGREVNDLGTNPLLGDTDGDGLWDGLEIQTGSNPLDPNSFNLAAALTSIAVAPTEVTIIFNTIFPEASRQLRVMGTLIDGRTVDITSRRYGTEYSSSDLAVASFGAEDGFVFAGQDGTAVVTVQIGSFSDTSVVQVESFSPKVLSFLALPGYPNGVVVTSDHAYVASGEAGLQVVDVRNPLQPFVAGAADTPGNANDVAVAGTLAYVADGAGGLQVLDVADPTAPRIVGSVVTPGPATDVAVAGGRAYVVDELGLRVLDVSDPASPEILGGVETPGRARGVAVMGEVVLVADSSRGIHVVDISDGTAPVILGSTPTRPNGASRAAAVAVRGSRVYVADGSDGSLGGLRVVEFQEPAAPVVIGSSNDNLQRFGLSGLAIEGNLAFGADFYFVNAVPIFDLEPVNPVYRAVLDFSQGPIPRDDNGSDVAVQNGFVFLTGGQRGAGADNVVSGSGGLHIGRYAVLEDRDGIAPVVKVTSPYTTALGRTWITVGAQALDDIRVSSVEFLVNGQPVGKDFGAPFEARVFVPPGVTEVALGARATDLGGNVGSAEPLVLPVEIFNPEPTVSLLVPVPGQRATEGTTISLVAQASDDQRVERVVFYVNGTSVHADETAPYRFDYAIPLGITEFAVTAVAFDASGPSVPAGPVVVEVEPDDPPTAEILEPTAGRQVVAGGLLTVFAGATDDVGVSRVRLLIDGQVEIENDEAPYLFEFGVPLGRSEIHLTVEAVDTLGQSTLSQEVSVSIVSDDPLTTATGTVVDPQGAAVAGANVICAGKTGTANADGTFSIPGVPTALGPIRCRASFRDAQNRDYTGTSQRVAPVPAGVTNMGQIQLQLTGAFLYPGPQLTVEADGVKIADFNGDGIPDLVAGAPFDRAAAVLLGTPNGSYEAVRYFETAGSGQFVFAGSPKDVVVGDFNGDTLPDIATANDGNLGISVLLGNGDGTFQSHIDSAGGTSPVALATGDFNEDGRLDLAAASGNLSVLLGNGNGTLTLSGSIAAGGSISVEVSDVNQDGHLDLISAQRTQSTVRIFLGNGTGAFTLNRTVSSSSPDDLTVADLNSDGRMDVATTSASGDRVRVFFRQADGSYLTGPVLTAGSDPLGVIASDMDTDGDLDLATANDGTSDVSLFLNNGNGSFSGAKVVFAGASPGDLAAGDLNRDGIADLVTADTLGLSLLFGLGNATFDTDQRYPAGESPAGLAVGDFNADGAQDLAVASQDSDEVAVLLGRGDGTFTAEQRFPAGSGPLDVVARDFNGDGKLDLATANVSGDSVSLLPGQGDGTFVLPTAFPAGDWPLALLTSDFNGDTHPDLAVANAVSNDVSVFLGNGDGTFTPQTRYPVGDDPVDLALGDFQGDGRPDLVTANDGTDDISSLSGNADGSFGPEVRPDLGVDPQPFPLSVAVADLDSDGNQDLVVSYLHESSPYRDHYGVLLGNGDGTFQAVRLTPTGPNPFGSLRIVDVNGDGIPDLVNASPGGAATQDILIALGQGDGTFGEPQRYAVGCAPYYLAAGDFNGDGQVDLATSTFGCYATYDISILIHH